MKKLISLCVSISLLISFSAPLQAKGHSSRRRGSSSSSQSCPKPSGANAEMLTNSQSEKWKNADQVYDLEKWLKKNPACQRKYRDAVDVGSEITREECTASLDAATKDLGDTPKICAAATAVMKAVGITVVKKYRKWDGHQYVYVQGNGNGKDTPDQRHEKDTTDKRRGNGNSNKKVNTTHEDNRPFAGLILRNAEAGFMSGEGTTIPPDLQRFIDALNLAIKQKKDLNPVMEEAVKKFYKDYGQGTNLPTSFLRYAFIAYADILAGLPDKDKALTQLWKYVTYRGGDAARDEIVHSLAVEALMIQPNLRNRLNDEQKGVVNAIERDGLEDLADLKISEKDKKAAELMKLVQIGIRNSGGQQQVINNLTQELQNGILSRGGNINAGNLSQNAQFMTDGLTNDMYQFARKGAVSIGYEIPNESIFRDVFRGAIQEAVRQVIRSLSSEITVSISAELIASAASAAAASSVVTAILGGFLLALNDAYARSYRNAKKEVESLVYSATSLAMKEISSAQQGSVSSKKNVSPETQTNVVSDFPATQATVIAEQTVAAVQVTEGAQNPAQGAQEDEEDAKGGNRMLVTPVSWSRSYAQIGSSAQTATNQPRIDCGDTGRSDSNEDWSGRRWVRDRFPDGDSGAKMRTRVPELRKEINKLAQDFTDSTKIDTYKLTGSSPLSEYIKLGRIHWRSLSPTERATVMDLEEIQKNVLPRTNSFYNTAARGNQDAAFVKAVKVNGKWKPSVEIGTQATGVGQVIDEVLAPWIVDTLKIAVCAGGQAGLGALSLGRGKSLRYKKAERGSQHHIHYEEDKGTYECNNSIDFAEGNFWNAMVSLLCQ